MPPPVSLLVPIQAGSSSFDAQLAFDGTAAILGKRFARKNDDIAGAADWFPPLFPLDSSRGLGRHRRGMSPGLSIFVVGNTTAAATPATA